MVHIIFIKNYSSIFPCKSAAKKKRVCQNRHILFLLSVISHQKAMYNL